MDREKIELILRLHKEGRITTEEAIILMPVEQERPMQIEPFRTSDWPFPKHPVVTGNA
jgi:hypothetical protein